MLTAHCCPSTLLRSPHFTQPSCSSGCGGEKPHLIPEPFHVKNNSYLLIKVRYMIQVLQQ